MAAMGGRPRLSLVAHSLPVIGIVQLGADEEFFACDDAFADTFTNGIANLVLTASARRWTTGGKNRNEQS